MPHLAPLSWILAPILFWSLMFLISSSIWWHQLPLMPQLLPKNLKEKSQWQWQ